MTPHYKKTDNFTAVSMRCNEEQFKELEPILRQNKIKVCEISSFNRCPYLVNNLRDVRLKISNVVDLAKEIKGRITHETYDKDLFLSCCGLEKVEEYTITKDQIKDLHQSNSIEAVRKKLERSYPNEFPKLEVGK